MHRHHNSMQVMDLASLQEQQRKLQPELHIRILPKQHQHQPPRPSLQQPRYQTILLQDSLRQRLHPSPWEQIHLLVRPKPKRMLTTITMCGTNVTKSSIWTRGNTSSRHTGTWSRASVTKNKTQHAGTDSFRSFSEWDRTRTLTVWRSGRSCTSSGVYRSVCRPSITVSMIHSPRHSPTCRSLLLIPSLVHGSVLIMAHKIKSFRNSVRSVLVRTC
mmetsp:Transcript_22701/g.53755  ORF Transcript_22701/g.53755 Transcript_22701/m.53755 type:complete len:216 (-) Transcript_22701:1393-2040(-)